MARREPIDLEPGEEILVATRVSFRGAAAASTRGSFSFRSGRIRVRAYDEWHDAAVAAGFPVVPPDMVIATTPRRLLFGYPTFWGRPPSQYSGAIDLGRIAQVVALRHGLVTGVAFAFTDGGIVQIEAMRGRALRQLVHVIDEHLERR